jgi:hypothetical protein
MGEEEKKIPGMMTVTYCSAIKRQLLKITKTNSLKIKANLSAQTAG